MKFPRFPHALILVVVLTVAGCTTMQPTTPAGSGAPTVAIMDRLYCGRDIPRGGEVSEDDWDKFLAEVVTPRFPSGFTVLRGEGQWRDLSGTIVREKTFIMEVNHADNSTADRAMLDIIAEYKRRFGQEAVFRVRARVDAIAL